MSKCDAEAVKELRGAVYRGDRSVVGLVRGRLTEEGCAFALASELERYYALSNERQRGRARAWLAAEGYRPAGASGPRR